MQKTIFATWQISTVVLCDSGHGLLNWNPIQQIQSLKTQSSHLGDIEVNPGSEINNFVDWIDYHVVTV